MPSESNDEKLPWLWLGGSKHKNKIVSGCGCTLTGTFGAVAFFDMCFVHQAAPVLLAAHQRVADYEYRLSRRGSNKHGLVPVDQIEDLQRIARVAATSVGKLEASGIVTKSRLVDLLEQMLDHSSCQRGRGYEAGGTVPQPCGICEAARTIVVQARGLQVLEMRRTDGE